VNTTGDVQADDSYIGGDIRTDGTVDVSASAGNATTVGGSIVAMGNIDVSDGSTAQGDLHSTNGGSITMTNGTALGDVATQEDVDVEDSVVGGNVYEDNGFSCDSSTIDGKSCGAYTPKDYDDY